jgi:hypothetical protein
MLFLDNPRKRRRRKARRTRAKVARRRRRASTTARNTRGQFMARRRRRASVRHTAPRRRRRRRHVVALAPRRRRRRAVVHHRRRYRRNPGMGSGIIGTLKTGIINGLKVNIGEAIQGRAASAIARVVPIGGIAGTAIAELGSAVAIALGARKFAPAHATMIAAGAFANANKHVLTAISPTAGALLGDVYGAYPGGGLGAYPGGGLGDASYIGGGIPEGAGESAGNSDYGAYPGGGLGEGAMEANYMIQ